jgi:nucleotide-binding universal stress UspA family protein
MKFANILVPTDFSPPADHALQVAIDVARQSGGKLLLVHVIDPPPYLSTMAAEVTTVAVLEIQERTRKWAQDRLAKIAKEKIPAGVQVETMLVEGIPFHEILELSRQKHSDLIVMATHGHTGVKHFLLGSTTERVVREAKCPVLTVR